MRLWYLSHRQTAKAQVRLRGYRRTAKAQARLRIRAVSLEPSMFVQIKYGSRRRVLTKIRRVVPVDCCSCVFED